MKELKQNPFVLTCIGLVAGIGLGIVVSLTLLSPNQDEHSPKGSATHAESASSDLTGDRANAQVDLASILEHDTATDRRLAVYRLLEGQSAQQIAESIRDSFKLSKVKHLTSVQNLLFATLARLDPKLALELVWETEQVNWNEFFTTVVEAWVSIDSQLAMQTGSELGEPWKSKAFRTILQTRQGSSDAEWIELAESFGATKILNELTFKNQIDEVIDEPRAAFELILQADIPDYRKSEMATLITKRWIESEDTHDISSMLSLVYELFSEEQYQWRLVVSTLAATDPKLVWEQLSTLSLDAQKMLNDEVFSVWVKQDPTAAINALNEAEYMSTESWELNSLYAAWASAVWHQLPERIDLVPDSYRSGMLTNVVRNLAPRIEPSELLEQLKQIQSRGVNIKNSLEIYFSVLSDKDPASALHWASEYLDKENYVFSSILQKLAVVDVTRAMEFALQQPVSSGAEQSVVQAMFSQGWLQQGLELLPKVRESTGATHLYASAGELLIKNGQNAEAVALAEQLSEEARPEYFEALAERWIFKDINEFLPVLSEIPSAENRSRVAERILRIDRVTGGLTDDEIEVVRTYVQVSAD